MTEVVGESDCRRQRSCCSRAAGAVWATGISRRLNRAPRYAQLTGRKDGEEGTRSSSNWKVLRPTTLWGWWVSPMPRASRRFFRSFRPTHREAQRSPTTPLRRAGANLGIVEKSATINRSSWPTSGHHRGARTSREASEPFLRHIERNSVLLFMIPADSDDIRRDTTSCWAN